MHVKKAVVTAAGRGKRQYPAADTVQKTMLPLVDRDGLTKPLIQIIAEEALESGIEEIGLVTAPGDQAVYERAFQSLIDNLTRSFPDPDWAREQANRLGDLQRRLRYAPQPEAEGYGHAVWCARDFVGDEPFLLLLSDHVYISGAQHRCARQVIDVAEREACSVSAVQPTREHLIHHYGTVGARRVPGEPSLYQIEKVLEKPALSFAEVELQVPGLRVGHYLCFFGMHVLTPAIFDILDAQMRDDRREGGEIQLSAAMNALAKREKMLAMETQGTRYDVGIKYGMVQAQIAFALGGVDRDEMLTRLVELMMQEQPRTGPGQQG